MSVTAGFEMSAGGAAPPSPAGGAGAGGGSKTQKRRAQREARLEWAQLAGELDAGAAASGASSCCDEQQRSEVASCVALGKYIV